MTSEKLKKYRLAYEKCIRGCLLNKKEDCKDICQTNFEKLDFKIPSKLINNKSPKKSAKKSVKKKSPVKKVKKSPKGHHA
jgi:hypothetical protein